MNAHMKTDHFAPAIITLIKVQPATLDAARKALAGSLAGAVENAVLYGMGVETVGDAELPYFDFGYKRAGALQATRVYVE